MEGAFSLPMAAYNPFWEKNKKHERENSTFIAVTLKFQFLFGIINY